METSEESLNIKEIEHNDSRLLCLKQSMKEITKILSIDSEIASTEEEMEKQEINTSSESFISGGEVSHLVAKSPIWWSFLSQELEDEIVLLKSLADVRVIFNNDYIDRILNNDYNDLTESWSFLSQQLEDEFVPLKSLGDMKAAQTDVRVIGVMGMGGVGKTTLLSRLIYPEIKPLSRLEDDIEFWNCFLSGVKKSSGIYGKYLIQLMKLLLPTQTEASLVPQKSLGDIKPLSRCYSAGYITSKDFATRCMVRKRKELIKEWLSTLSLEQLAPSQDFIDNELVDNPGNQTLLKRPSDRNRKKRLKKKVKNKAKREEMENNSLRSNTSLLYMFASMHSGGYLLFRIDALEYTCKYNENPQLLPLLVFGPGILPVGFCTMVHLGHYIYFVGEEHCDVFKIRKDDLRNLTPSEDNLGLVYLIPMKKPMQGPKRNPLVFVANDKLYVISQDYSCKSHEFERYSPTDDSWTDLNPQPKGHGPLKSHVVLDNVAYFATTDETVLSCNLTDGCWSVVSTAPKYPRTFCDIHPAFDAPVVIVGDMILGAFKLPSDFNITVAASPYSRCDEAVKDSFMRPTLAPDSKFWPEFARRFDYIRNDENRGSHYMTALQTLDGQNILCFVSYGSNPSTDEPHRSYALLTFYMIQGDHWKTSVRLKEEVLEGGDTFCYYSRQVEAGNAVKSYFNSEFMHRKLFNITTTKLRTTGKLITCLAF